MLFLLTLFVVCFPNQNVSSPRAGVSARLLMGVPDWHSIQKNEGLSCHPCPAPPRECPGLGPAVTHWVSRHLLLWVSEGKWPWWGLVCSLPPCWVLIAHRLLGEEGLGDGGGELEGAGLGQL